MSEFFQTMMGRKFYESDVPRIASALAKIATALGALPVPTKKTTLSDIAATSEHLGRTSTEGRDEAPPPRRCTDARHPPGNRCYYDECSGCQAECAPPRVAEKVKGRMEMDGTEDLRCSQCRTWLHSPTRELDQTMHTEARCAAARVRRRRPSRDEDFKQPTLESILERAEHDQGIPGILFPTNHSAEHCYAESVDGQVFIACSDQAGMFQSDVDAANFLACLIGKPWKKFFDQPGKPYFFPYFEITLEEAEEIHRKYGSKK
jgi:hypothetical protein